jgi:RimJ/RimL family protein N-acetyltransferase
MITLRPFVDTDARLLLDWISTEEQMVLWSGTMFSWPLTELRLAATAISPFRRSWIGEDHATGAAVGHITLSVDERHRNGRISCVLIAPAARGGGHGAALVNAILDMAFDELRLHRVGLGVFTHNATALRLYERLGFVREGVIRDSAHVGGEWWSSVEMGMLESERPAGRR